MEADEYKTAIAKATHESFVASLCLEALDPADEWYNSKYDMYEQEMMEAEERLYGLHESMREEFGFEFA